MSIADLTFGQCGFQDFFRYLCSLVSLEVFFSVALFYLRNTKIVTTNKSKGFTKISLFEKAECYQDSDGLWQIDLGASVSAMKYIFNPENLGYLRYPFPIE